MQREQIHSLLAFFSTRLKDPTWSSLPQFTQEPLFRIESPWKPLQIDPQYIQMDEDNNSLTLLW